MKKNGFTLVELLAVIVILAIILVIAVPKISDTIDNAKRGSMASSVKMIAAAAERENLCRAGVLCRKKHSAHHFQYRGDHEAGGSCRELSAESG